MRKGDGVDGKRDPHNQGLVSTLRSEKHVERTLSDENRFDCFDQSFDIGDLRIRGLTRLKTKGSLKSF